MKKIMQSKILIAVVCLLGGLVISYFIFSKSAKPSKDKHEHAEAASEIWTCAMHPQIRLTEPGKCPICGMDLVIVKQTSDETYADAIELSEKAMLLAEVQTTKVVRQQAIKDLRLNGKIKADERRVMVQSAHSAGRVEQLFLNFTGETVKKGQFLATLYSPELQTAAEELLQAYQMKETQAALYAAARIKLSNWKLSDAQIDKIIQDKKASSRFPLLADVSGVVTNKMISLGDYVQKGQSLFEIADLSTVWVMLDVYETDLVWVKTGQEIEFQVASLAGEKFKGKIDYIDPVIDMQTRVAKARISVSNAKNRLKPEMFVSAVLHSNLQSNENALIVPASAVLWTGKRSIVYVQTDSSKAGRFNMQEIVLGASLGDYYVVTGGLKEGQIIVSKGSFSVDAAAQLAGKPSMMQAKEEKPKTENNGANAKEIHKALGNLVDAYLRLKDHLVDDAFDKSLQSAKDMQKQLNGIDTKLFESNKPTVWMAESMSIKKSLSTAVAAKDIEGLRIAFKNISDRILKLTKEYKPNDETLYLQHCPMANSNKGADWLSDKKEIRNPYFGSEMLSCGEVKEKL